jgi:hypothetical protein
MKASELKSHLMTLGFKSPSQYIIEDGFQIPSSYTIHQGIKLQIDIIEPTYGEKKLCVEFTLGGVNLYAIHKLEELDFKTLHLELGKIIGLIPKFLEWTKVESRNSKLDSIYERKEIKKNY